MAAGNEALSAAAARLAAEGVRHSTADRQAGGSRHDFRHHHPEAVRWDADLLVLGTHGRRGVKRPVMGSVAEGVLHKSGKPVLLIRSEAPTERSAPAADSPASRGRPPIGRQFGKSPGSSQRAI